MAHEAANVTTVTVKPHVDGAGSQATHDHAHGDHHHEDHRHASDDHGHGHLQNQMHQHAHQHAPAGRAIAQAPGFSLMRVSLGERLLMAAALSALLWVAIAGVLWT